MGVKTLVRILQGDGRLDERPRADAHFGRLSFLTAGKIEALVEELREEGLLKTITYSHGGTGLGLSVTGSALVHRAQTDSQ